jgi:hypothetical protein
VATEVEEPFLELSASELFPRVVKGDSQPEPGHTSPSATTAEQLVHLRQIEETFYFRLLDGVSKLSVGRLGR